VIDLGATGHDCGPEAAYGVAVIDLLHRHRPPGQRTGSVTVREATEEKSAVKPVTWSTSLIRFSRSITPHRLEISYPLR
jgi:hypothetical protein